MPWREPPTTLGEIAQPPDYWKTLVEFASLAAGSRLQWTVDHLGLTEDHMAELLDGLLPLMREPPPAGFAEAQSLIRQDETSHVIDKLKQS